MSEQTKTRTQPGHRINVIGTTGAGKTTVAAAISRRLGVPHIEMDALFWKPHWVETPDDELFAKVDRATAQPAWVVDGNYSRTRSIIWPKADTVIWLDYPFVVVFAQLLRRTFQRAVAKQPMWDGCIEDWRTVFSKDSILLWCITTHRRRKRNYPRALAKPEHAHLQLIHLRSRRQTRRWLASLEKVAET